MKRKYRIKRRSKRFEGETRIIHITIAEVFAWIFCAIIMAAGIMLFYKWKNSDQRTNEKKAMIRTELLIDQNRQLQKENEALRSLNKTQAEVYDSFFLEDYDNGLDELHRILWSMKPGDKIQVKKIEYNRLKISINSISDK